MTILYIVTGLGIGGAEIVTVDIANNMVQRGHQVSIISLADINELQERIDSRIDVHIIGMGKTPISFFKAIMNARDYIKRTQPDVVHANMVHANIFARILRIFVHMDYLISTAHSSNEGGNLRMWAYRLTDCMSDLNTNVSKDAVAHYVRNKWFSPKKSIHVYNGIDQSIFSPKPEVREKLRTELGLKEEDFCLLFVGRMTEAKDIPNLLDAFAIVSKAHSSAKLVLVGGGTLQKGMQQLAESKGLGKSVYFAGSRSDVINYYNMADCFVMSSAWEGFGMVLVEAMSCHLPVITTNAGGCAEIVSSEKYIVPIKNPLALAEKIEMVMSMNQEELQQLRQENYRLSRRFSLEAIVGIWEKIYVNKSKDNISQ